MNDQLPLPAGGSADPEDDAPVGPRWAFKTDIEQALRERFVAPQWALFFEVPSATGGGASRRADAIAMALWPSLGLEIIGIEIKVDRGDMRRELKSPAKAQELSRFCDRWYVAAAAGVVKIEELPPAWGLLVLRGKTLRQEREAPKLEAQPIERSFLASLLRAASEANPAELAIQKAVQTARVQKRAAAKKQREAEEGCAQQKQEILKKAVADFEATSGIAISDYSGPALGDAVRLVLERQWRGRELEQTAKRLHKLAGDLEAAQVELDALTAPPAADPPATGGAAP